MEHNRKHAQHVGIYFLLVSYMKETKELKTPAALQYDL